MKKQIEDLIKEWEEGITLLEERRDKKGNNRVSRVSMTGQIVGITAIIVDLKKILEAFDETSIKREIVCRTCNGTKLVYIDNIIKSTLCPDC